MISEKQGGYARYTDNGVTAEKVGGIVTISVYKSGATAVTTSWETITTLPEGFRPFAAHYISSVTAVDSFLWFYVSTAGAVMMKASANGNYTLLGGGICYPAYS